MVKELEPENVREYKKKAKILIHNSEHDRGKKLKRNNISNGIFAGVFVLCIVVALVAAQWGTALTISLFLLWLIIVWGKESIIIHQNHLIDILLGLNKLEEEAMGEWESKRKKEGKANGSTNARANRKK